MRNLQSRNSKKRWLYSRITLVFVFLLAIFLGRAAVRAYMDARAVRVTYNEIRSEREELAAEKTDILRRLDYLSSSYGLEKELKQQFGLVGPGEEIIVIVDRPEQKQEADGGDGLSFFEGIRQFLRGLF